MVVNSNNKLTVFLLIGVAFALIFSLSYTLKDITGNTILDEQYIEGEIEGFFIANSEKVDVIIALDYDMDKEDLDPGKYLKELENEVEKKVNQALQQFGDGQFTEIKRFKYTYAVAGKITPEGLETIKGNKSAFAAVYLDRKYLIQTYNPKQGLSAEINLPTSSEIKLSSGDLDGNGVTVCLVDTGIDYDNQKLKDKIIDNQCFCEGCCSNDADDDNGHGTAMASLLVGKLNSSDEGVKGIVPASKLINVKVCDEKGRCGMKDVLRGIEYCLEKSEDQDVSIILSGIGDDEKRRRHCPIVFDSGFKHFPNVIPIFPVGNNFFKPGVNYPACSPEVIGVGSLDETNNQNALFSNEGDSLDIHAPGTDILASKLNGKFDEQSGTSISASIVAGGIALIKQVLNDKDEDKTTEEILKLLDITALPTGDGYKKLDIKEALKRIGAGYAKSTSTYERDDLGKIDFKNIVNLNGIETCVTIEQGLVDFDLSKCPHLDQPATITIYHPQGPEFRVLRNGQTCNLFCKNIRNKPTETSFDVFSMGRFTLQAVHSQQDDPDNPDEETLLFGEEVTIKEIEKERNPKNRINVTFKNVPKLGKPTSTGYILLSFLVLGAILLICVLSFRTYYRPSIIDMKSTDSKKLEREMAKREPKFKWKNPLLRQNIPAKLKKPIHKGIEIIRGEKKRRFRR